MIRPRWQTARLKALIAGLLLLAGNEAMSLETPDYTVVFTDGELEYRLYEPYLVAETLVHDTADYKDAGNVGFRRLFSYISGSNSAEAKIAMTAPVERIPSGETMAMTAPVEQFEATEGWYVTFMLPSEYSPETAPIPTDDRVRLRLVPGRLMAVLRYSGRWTEKNFLEQRASLLDAVSRASLEPLGETLSAAYDPPFMLPFMRRNEVMVEVARVP